MAPPSGGGGQGSQDSSTSLMWVLILLFVVGVAVWYFAGNYLIIAYLKFKSVELFFLSFFTSQLDVVRQWIAVMPPEQIGFADLKNVASVIGDYFKIPVMVILGLCAVYVYHHDPTRRYKRTYDMKAFLNAERENWPQINPIAHLDLVKEDINKGPWAMSMPPMQFAKRYQLLEEEILPLQEGQLSKDQKLGVKLKRGEANKIFALQLGGLWTRPSDLPIHVKALFVAFVARTEGDNQVSVDLLTQIARSSLNGKLNFTGVEALIEKYQAKKVVKKLAAKHAYTLTFMASLLELARASGVLATAEFLWLKPVDRRMWYMLNNVGRQTAFCEVAGPFSHWLTEKELGRKISAPMIDGAAQALELALSEIVYKPDRDLEAQRLGIEE